MSESLEPQNFRKNGSLGSGEMGITRINIYCNDFSLSTFFSFLFVILFQAPVARQIKFYNVPLLTAGGFTFDYNKPKTNPNSEFYLLTKTGFSFNAVAETVFQVFDRYYPVV